MSKKNKATLSLPAIVKATQISARDALENFFQRVNQKQIPSYWYLVDLHNPPPKQLHHGKLHDLLGVLHGYMYSMLMAANTLQFRMSRWYLSPTKWDQFSDGCSLRNVELKKARCVLMEVGRGKNFGL